MSGIQLTKEQMIQEYMSDSEQNLNCSLHNISGGFFKPAINRAYYCALDAINACLTTIDILDHKNHGFVIGKFREHFIKTHVFEVTISDNLGELFDLRQDSDYSKGFYVGEEEAKELAEKATVIYETISSYITDYLIKLSAANDKFGTVDGR